MYLKKLELFGFKSFAEKTELIFEPGITAVVGPNGCGKSNVFDSIRWVLGEQSMKELRGSSREDVIFNGTQKHPALGMAEVSLTFSNENRQLPIEYDEVTVTRRLYRSGESQYLLNKTIVRLKDVQELFMGTGVGAEAYSLLPQGKVDLVVSAKPDERRQIIDEASGITKYNAKKKEAMSKLKDTENNLLRLNDIITEVKRQIATCERQAAKARRYKEKFDRLKAMEVLYAHFQIASLEQRRAELEKCLSDMREKETTLNSELEEISNQLTFELNHCDEIEQQISEVREEEIRLNGQIDINNKQIAFNEERIESIIQNNERMRNQKEQLIGKCHLQQEKIAELEQEEINARERFAVFEKEIVLKRDGLMTLETLIKEAREKIKENEEKVMSLSTSQVVVRNDLTDVMKEMQTLLARKRRLDLEQEKLLNEKTEVERKLDNVENNIKSLQGEIFDLQSKRQDEMLVLTRMQNDMKGLDAKIADLEKRRMFLCSQQEFIEKMHVQYQDIPDPIIEGRLITKNPPAEKHNGILGKVKSVNEIEARDIEEGGIDGGASYKLYEIICETKFVELDLEDISRRIDQMTSEINDLIAAKKMLQETTGKQEELIKQFDGRIVECEKKMSVLESQRDDIREELAKIDDETALLAGERDEVNEELGSVKKREDETNRELQNIDQELSWYQNDIKEKQVWINQKSQEKESLAVSIAQVETELQSAEGKLKGLSDSAKMLKETMDNWLEEIQNIENELSSQNDKTTKFEIENNELGLKIDSIINEKESLQAVLADHMNKKEDAARRINAMRSNMRSFEEELDGLKQQAYQQQLNGQELSYGEKGIIDRLTQTYKIDINNVPEEVTQQDLGGLSADSEEFVQTLEELRKQCDSFGSVNLVAIEEYEELKQRFEFLTKQQVDLLEAKSHLMNTIQKINRSTRQMFMETFTKVSEEFRIYFRMLFGGGDAELILLDPENVLESGIDIIARPPGKKLQNISLLSGGEKTLTAIALIFGVFKVNPSPFCVLDEIDAALDESNVGRFSFLLKEFANISQFIVITHNKKTMSGSNVMYGVTMPETGISRVVSVKFLNEEDKKDKPLEMVGAEA
jgi:chromosome segregation protein